jgi:hypothetical protein
MPATSYPLKATGYCEISACRTPAALQALPVQQVPASPPTKQHVEPSVPLGRARLPESAGQQETRTQATANGQCTAAQGCGAVSSDSWHRSPAKAHLIIRMPRPIFFAVCRPKAYSGNTVWLQSCQPAFQCLHACTAVSTYNMTHISAYMLDHLWCRAQVGGLDTLLVATIPANSWYRDTNRALVPVHGIAA